MNPGRFSYLCMAIVASLVFLNGCVVPVAPPPTFPSATSLPATTTPTPGPVSSTRTLMPAPTPKPPTPTVPPSPTLAPTLTADQEQALVLDLLQNNAGCRLPCWWGFTPGKTTWQTASTFFTSLGKNIINMGRSYTSYGVEFTIMKYDIRLSQEYVVINGNIAMIWVGIGMVRNEKAVFGDPLFAKALQYYMLPHLLTAYGLPDEVLIRTFSSAPGGGWVPFHLLLFYPMQGILVDYQGPNEKKGNNLQWCPQNTNITMWLWMPERKLTLKDISRIGPNLPLEEVLSYHPIEEATGMSLREFYETFKEPGNSLCLETPVDMWP